jgi:murein DD-endopeptidase MepM/ murein hydrolase activator NlpD
MKCLPFKTCVPKDYPEGSVTQWFGKNPTLYAYMDMKGHNGIDLVSAWGTPLYAVDDGIIGEVKEDPSGYGKHIRLITPKYVEWTYGHLSEINVKVGQEVNAGDLIGKMGNTGFVVSGSTPFWKYNPYSGTHLHLGRREGHKGSLQVVTYSTGISCPIDAYDNGFKGALDFKYELIEAWKGEIITESLTLISLLNQAITFFKNLGK